MALVSGRAGFRPPRGASTSRVAGAGGTARPPPVEGVVTVRGVETDVPTVASDVERVALRVTVGTGRGPRGGSARGVFGVDPTVGVFPREVAPKVPVPERPPAGGRTVGVVTVDRGDAGLPLTKPELTGRETVRVRPSASSVSRRTDPRGVSDVGRSETRRRVSRFTAATRS